MLNVATPAGVYVQQVFSGHTAVKPQVSRRAQKPQKLLNGPSAQRPEPADRRNTLDLFSESHSARVVSDQSADYKR